MRIGLPAVFLLTVSALGCATPAPELPGYQVFELAELRAARAEAGTAYHAFLSEASFAAGLYHLPAGARDGQSPHDLDEIYYVHSGRARLTVGEQEFAVEAGDVLFVAAGQPHRFHDISAALELIVVFSKQAPSGAASPGLSIDAARQTVGRSAEVNVWNPFMVDPTMRLGMSLLPAAAGCDETLVHPWDGLNLELSEDLDVLILWENPEPEQR